MATLFKTDLWQQYMLYRKDDYSRTIFFSREQKKAVEAGKKFVTRAYPDVWAKDAALVQRVREFLGTNFHWHDRLAKTGSDLEIVQTLFDMVNGESVVVIPEDGSRSAGIGSSLPEVATKAPASGGLSYLEQLRLDDAADAFT